jgi:hypothetical protein
MANYEIEYSFILHDTQEKLYRVKVTYSSGDITYHVINDKELNLLNLGGK